MMAGTEFARSYRSRYAEAVFEDAKTKMEAALQAHIEGVLRKHPGKKVA
jgi:hypothetical protein